MLDKILEYDRELFVYLNNLGIEKFDAFWGLVTKIYFWIPLYVLFIFFILKSFKKPEANKVLTMAAVLVASTVLLTETVRNLVGRLRPANNPELSDLIRVLQTPTNYSFFSGHAANSFALSTFMFLVLRKKWNWPILFFIWPILFSISRIYVGVHYPSDILVGTIVGISLGILFYAVLKRRLYNPAQH